MDNNRSNESLLKLQSAINEALLTREREFDDMCKISHGLSNNIKLLYGTMVITYYDYSDEHGYKVTGKYGAFKSSSIPKVLKYLSLDGTTKYLKERRLSDLRDAINEIRSGGVFTNYGIGGEYLEYEDMTIDYGPGGGFIIIKENGDSFRALEISDILEHLFPKLSTNNDIIYKKLAELHGAIDKIDRVCVFYNSDKGMHLSYRDIRIDYRFEQGYTVSGKSGVEYQFSSISKVIEYFFRKEPTKVDELLSELRLKVKNFILVPIKPPEYVWMINGKSKCALKLMNYSGSDCYYRAAGNWFVDIKYENGKMRSVDTTGEQPQMTGAKLIACTEEEWRNDNQGYV